jgi:hypothetical protein
MRSRKSSKITRRWWLYFMLYNFAPLTVMLSPSGLEVSPAVTLKQVSFVSREL